jgi:hypothetical protein
MCNYHLSMADNETDVTIHRVSVDGILDGAGCTQKTDGSWTQYGTPYKQPMD